MQGFVLLAIASLALAVPLTNQRTFGHAIKNGPLPPQVELQVFGHTCVNPPCTLTLVHIPSIYPTSGDPFNWEGGWIRFYVDGEQQPSIALTLLELASVGSLGAVLDNQPADGSPWGTALQGKTARSGGVYSTVRIPFGRTLNVTIESANEHEAILWCIFRGLESMPVVLGDLELPATARLQVVRTVATPNPLDFVTIANVSSANAGALLKVQYSAESKDFNFLEACFRAVIDGNAQPLWLSSGTEDYFLSASYFDEGMFKTPNSGLTFYDPDIGSLSAYKTHERDPVIFQSGFQLITRNNEDTQGCGDTLMLCPNQWCPPGQKQRGSNTSAVEEHVRKMKRGSPMTAPADFQILTWLYTWPSPGNLAGASASRDLKTALQNTWDLSKAGRLSAAQEDAVVDRLTQGDSVLEALLTTQRNPDDVSRHVNRYICKKSRVCF